MQSMIRIFIGDNLKSSEKSIPEIAEQVKSSLRDFVLYLTIIGGKVWNRKVFAIQSRCNNSPKSYYA